MASEREIPFYPRRGREMSARFSQMLVFQPLEGRLVSQWVSDRTLDRQITQLMAMHPDKGEKEWLIYFLTQLKDTSLSNADRKTAQKALFCFYQETCFWTVKKLWRKLSYLYPPVTWLDVFAIATAPFETLEDATATFKTFDPNQSTKNYIKILVYRRIQHWLDQQTGKGKQLIVISLEQSHGSLEEDKYRLHQPKIEQQMISKQENQEDIVAQKISQNRILEIIERELKQLEEETKRFNQPTIGKTKVTLWVTLLLSYGLNLMQSGTAKLLQANQKNIAQYTLARNFQTFKISLFIKCIQEFSEELKELFLNNFDFTNLERDPQFKTLAQENQKAVDGVLEDYCQHWFIQNVLSSLESSQPQQIINTLTHWLECSFQLLLNLACLTDAQRKKFDKAIALFQQELNPNS